MIIRWFALFFAGLCFAQGPRLQYHADSRRISFGPVENARLGLTLNGKAYWAADARNASWQASRDGGTLALEFPGVTWTLTARQDGTTAFLDSTLRNTGTAALTLGRARLADLTDASSRLAFGDGAAKSVVFVASGSQQKTYVRPVHGKTHALSHTLAQLWNPVSKQSLQFAFVTFTRMQTEQEIWWDDARQSIAASVYCDFDGFSLAPGATTSTETLAIGLRPDPVESLEHWGDLVQARYRPHIPDTLPAGWLGWSWVDGFYVERYEDIVKRNVRAVRERLPGLDIHYVWVSIGNLENNLPGNWLKWNFKNFPSGPQALIKDLGDRDFRLGFWIAPFWFTGVSNNAERLRPAFIHVGGKPMLIPHHDLGATHTLDPTHPITHDFLREVFGEYRKWGVRYFMIDFLNAVSGPLPSGYHYDRFHNPGLIPGPETMRDGLKAVREAAGPDTYLLGSTGPTYQLTGIADGMRTGSDYGEGRPLYGPGKGFYPGTYVVNKPDFWNGHDTALRAISTAFFTHRKLYISDSGNVLTLDKPLPLPDAQIAATIFGINGGPVMMGDDISRMDDQRLEMLKKEFPRLPETAVPLDLFESPDPDYAKVFRLSVKQKHEQYELAAVFNLGSGILSQRLDLTRFGLKATDQVAVWDFWNERYLGLHSGKLDVSVGPRAVLLLRLSPVRPHPWLLSSDLHIRQGQAEIEDCRWDAAKQELTITAARPAGYRGSIYIRAPKGLAVKNPAGLWMAKDGTDSSLIIRYPVSFGPDGKDTRTIGFFEYR